MSEQKLDQIVKGAPPPDAKLPTPPSSRAGSPALGPSPAPSVTNTIDPADPISTLPSSPPQIYLNLLILEASLRSQYLTLRARRRQHTFFVGLLTLWVAYFFYALFLRPREDGRGVGGSVYWVVEMGEKVALMGGVVTAILMWGTGQWERGIRWPRRWLGIANRGLRGINAKLVVIKGPWWKEALSHLSLLFPFSFLATEPTYTRFEIGETHQHRHRGGRQVEDEEAALMEEDLNPGGDYVKLLLLPKPFSPDFRENWELYRTEYWEKENERRADLRQKLRQREKMSAKGGGPFWWLGSSSRKRAKLILGKPGEKAEKHHHHRHNEKEPKPRRPGSARSGSHSRGSSRSTTPTFEDEKPERVRRGSCTADRRKKVKTSASAGSTRAPKMTSINDRPASPRLSPVDLASEPNARRSASAAHTRSMSRAEAAGNDST